MTTLGTGSPSVAEAVTPYAKAMNRPAVDLLPIRENDASAVAEFFHRHHNQAVSKERWLRVVRPPWHVEAPNAGFKLVAQHGVVGAYLAVYCERDWDGRQQRVCNLAALCVLPEYRIHTLRLMRSLISQPDFVFTDLSPSGNVVRMNERLGFQQLKSATRLTPNLPFPSRRGLELSASPALLTSTLTGRDHRSYQDHVGAPAARHLLVRTRSSYAYMVFRRDRRKGLPIFASPLYVGGDRELLQAAWPQVGAFLLFRHRLPATLAEHRILGFVPSPGRTLRNPRPKMVRSGDHQISDAAVDYLYSELTLLEW